MTIAVDCRMIDASGIGVYLRGILPFFLQTQNDFLLFGSAKRLHSFTSNANVKIIGCNVKPFSIEELFFFPGKTTIQINKVDVYFSPFFNIPCGIKIPVYTTIYDIIFPDMPELTSKAGLAVRMWFFRRAYKKSRKIFTISKFSKSRIEHHLGTEKPVVVTHSAIQKMFLEYRANAKNVQKIQIIVFIGNIKKHKGLDCLLDAFFLAKKENLPHRLIIIGSKDNFRTSDNTILKKIEKIGSDAVSFTGFVSDENLIEHLATAALLVQPSLYEGFCHPPLEAMVLGTHALISDIPVLKEIYSDYPVTFFRSGDSNDLKEKLLELLLNKSPEFVNLPEYLVNKYTFQKTASVILQNLFLDNK
jgi:glycosyltransferase involved in cell wall biosynthesis